ncbi:MAG: MFS transporter [Myxococcales bacterium]|nr:MFS transporter [Myxococcales bacterium]
MQTSATIVKQAGGATRRYVPGLRFWIAVLLMGVTFVNYLDRTALAVVAPTLKTRLSIDEQHYSYVLVAFQISYAVMQPVVGRIIDWLNLRVGLALSITWWSVAQMLAGLAGGWPAFAALRALLGMGEAGNFPAGAKAVSQWFRPSERTVATGIFNMGAGLGQAIAAPLGVFLLLHYGWQSTFVVTGAIGVLWVVVWLSFYRAPEEHRWMSPAELAYVKEGQGELVVPDEAIGRAVWKVVLGRRKFWAIGVARFLSEPAWQLFTYWIPLYLVTERHVDLKGIAVFAWMPFVAADLGCLFGGVLSPAFLRMGASVITARKLSALVCALLMVNAVFISRAPSAGSAVAWFCVVTFAHQAMSSTLLTLPADVFPRRAVATANGLSGTMAMVGGAIFTAVVGVVAKRSYTPLFLAISVFDLVGTAFLWTLLRPGDLAQARPQKR